MGHDATRLLKQLSAAIKTAALYPPSHPGYAKAVDALFTALQAHMETQGPCCIDVGKDSLAVNEVVVDDRAHANLAYALYSRSLVQLKILPAVTRPQLAAFLGIVAMDRMKVEEAGGVAHLLQDAGVAGGIVVTELALDVDEDAEILGIDAFFSLLGHSRLSLSERDRLIEILRAGPEPIGKLLQNTYALAREAPDGKTEEGQIRQVLEVVRGLDRLILDEPFDERPSLYTNLAEAIVLLEKPLGPNLAHAMLLEAHEDVAVQVIADHLTAEELATWMLSALAEGDAVAQVVAAMQRCGLDREKAKGVLGLLDARLSRRGADQAAIADALARALASLPSRTRLDSPAVELKLAQTAVTEEELERYIEQAAAIDEPSSVREVIKTCIDLLANEMDKEELVDLADVLAGYLFWLVERREFTLLRDILVKVKRIDSTARGARAEVISGLLESVTHGPLLDQLLDALWQGRATPEEQEVGDCVEVLADEMVDPLMHVLGTEPRAGMRAILCDLLVRIGPGRVDELGSFVADSRWYLVRNVASILGRLGVPQGIPYLARLIHHWDYRVRAQTVDALVNIGTDDAQGLIVAFLNDADQRIRLRALRALDARGMRGAMSALIGLLDRRDPFNRLFTLRHAVIEAVARLGVRDALPALERLARPGLVLSRQGRELRRLARTAASIIDAGEATAEEHAS